MKKTALIILLFAYGCSNTPTKQHRAEETVKKYIVAHKWKENVKDLKFTLLDDNNVIGVEEHGFDKDSMGRLTLRKTIYFSLNKDLTEAGCCFTE